MNRHVPSPNPATFWPFVEGQTRTIGYDPFLSFQVARIHTAHIEGVLTLGAAVVRDALRLDTPVVIAKCRETGEPMVTLTLRKVEDGKAFLQVTANPKINVGTVA